MNKYLRIDLRTVSFSLLLLSIAVPAYSQGTSFSYQGKLTDGGNLADGLFDMQFKLFDTATVGTGIQHGGIVTNPAVQVSNGTFTVQLDFGADAFNGSPRYLEIGIRPSGGTNPHTILAPRQPVTATPYAIRSVMANTATNALQLGGFTPSGFIQNSATQQSSTNFNISGNGSLGGTLSAETVNAASQYNLGGNRMLSTPGFQNLFVGSSTGSANTSGSGNSFFGALAGLNNTEGSTNSFFGNSAGINNSTGAGNTFVGYQTGLANITQNNNTFIGFRANGIGGITNATAIGANATVTQSNSLALGSGVNVGIGTGSPDRSLTVQRNGGAYLNLRDGNGPFEVLVGADAAGGIVSTMSNHDLQLRAGGNSPKMIIKADGSVIIGPFGAGPPPGRLQVKDSIAAAYFAAIDPFGVGVRGEALAGIGVIGSSNVLSGVQGISASGPGVLGSSTSGLGVSGSSSTGIGVFATSGGSGLTSPALRADNTNPSGIGIWATSNSVDSTLVVTNAGSGDLIRGFSTISGDPIFAVQNNGTTSTRVLQITGGSDLAEHFEIVDGARPGLVVAIDPLSAGKLMVARGAYNRRVAGIISGAGNLSAGMVLPDPSAAKKSLPVALSGRVWVYCDATRRPVTPGDLLTTSDMPGHAMKVTNYVRAQGAIIGKAMTGLKSGRGLVLALVSLQ